MEIRNMDISEPLRICLSKFTGAVGKTREAREKSLLDPFETIARKMIYGGYLRVRNDYAIFISTVEFYYHEEVGPENMKVEDKIVYHRNGRFLQQLPDGSFATLIVPYFPLMRIHSHWSGFDITFESSTGSYRASALIREYAVYDLNAKAFLKLDTVKKDSLPIPQSEKKYFVGVMSWRDEPYIDKRSSYLNYYLNGFSISHLDSDVEWLDLPQVAAGDVYTPKKGRQNAGDHDWAFCGMTAKEHMSQVADLLLSGNR